MMVVQMGVAFLCIWLGNLFWIIFQVVRYTPNWRDDNVSVEDIMMNFMTNATLDQIEFIRKVSQINPMIGMSGVALLLMALII